jgi:cytochrome P450
VASFPIGATATLEELEADPHPLLARLRESEPVSWLPALNAWLITRRDLALQAMRDPDTFTVDDPRFSTGQVVGPSMLTLDGSEHRRHRDPFAHPFRLEPVRERFAALVHDEASALLDQLAPAGSGELRRGFAGPLAARIVAFALGLQQIETATILGWYDAIVDATTGISAGRPVSEAGREAATALREALEPSIAGDPGSSLVAAAASVGGLSHDEVASNAAVLMFGGIETTEGMIVNALWHLLTHQDQLEAVRAQPLLLPGAVEESLRLEPAAATIDRYATRDTELGGAPIARGDLVTISIAAANRDPASFPDPDRFDVRRDNAGRHVAFAGGPHVCIGMHLARLEAHSALELALDRLPNLRLAEATAPRGLVFRKPPALNASWDAASAP